MKASLVIAVALAACSGRDEPLDPSPQIFTAAPALVLEGDGAVYPVPFVLLGENLEHASMTVQTESGDEVPTDGVVANGSGTKLAAGLRIPVIKDWMTARRCTPLRPFARPTARRRSSSRSWGSMSSWFRNVRPCSRTPSWTRSAPERRPSSAPSTPRSSSQGPPPLQLVGSHVIRLRSTREAGIGRARRLAGQDVPGAGGCRGGMIPEVTAEGCGPADLGGGGRGACVGESGRGAGGGGGGSFATGSTAPPGLFVGGSGGVGYPNPQIPP